MDRGILLSRKSEIETDFDNLTKQKTDIEDEMKRLQGEHRLINDILSKVTDATPDVEKPKKRIRKVVEDA